VTKQRKYNLILLLHDSCIIVSSTRSGGEGGGGEFAMCKVRFFSYQFCRNKSSYLSIPPLSGISTDGMPGVRRAPGATWRWEGPREAAVVRCAAWPAGDDEGATAAAVLEIRGLRLRLGMAPRMCGDGERVSQTRRFFS